MDEASSILLKRARAGSREALDTLFAECGERLLTFIRVRLGRELRAQLESGDILQMTLTQAFQRVDGFKGDSRKTLAAWLAAIAQNVIRDQADYARRQRRDAGRTVPLSAEAETVGADIRSQCSRIILKEETRRLEEAMEALEPLHREVILLRKYEEMSFPEIAERLGKTPDACRMLLARAMTSLTKKMRKVAE